MRLTTSNRRVFLELQMNGLLFFFVFLFGVIKIIVDIMIISQYVARRSCIIFVFFSDEIVSLFYMVAVFFF